jgi:hypothetical protein
MNYTHEHMGMKRQSGGTMPLRIDTTKCTGQDPAYNRTIADAMYWVGVGQLRNRDEARKFYHRYVVANLVRKTYDFPLTWAIVETFVGSHTNVSDMSDHKFKQACLLELDQTAKQIIDREERK